MLWNAKNGEAVVGSTKMSYVSFGWGDRILILLPGLSDGLTTVKGKALLLAKPFNKSRGNSRLFNIRDESGIAD